MPGKLKAPSSMDGLLQVPPPAARPVVPLKASADPEFSSLALAPVPPVFGTSTDAARQFYRTGVSQVRMPPLPTQSSQAVGAQISSHVAQAIEGASITLQVNGVSNPDQNLLNLTGSGISYGPGAGEVVIVSEDDGLDHGTSPWETDPSSVIMVDDFVSGNATSGSVGALGWWAGVIGSSVLTLSSYGAPNVGSVRLQADAAANSGVMLSPVPPDPSGDNPVGFPITYNTGWDCSFIFRWPNTESGIANPNTKARVYLGFAVHSVTNTAKRPAKFCGLQYDTDPGASFTLTAAGNASSGVTAYTGTFTGGGSNAFQGFQFTITGFASGGNNGTFICCGSSKQRWIY